MTEPYQKRVQDEKYDLNLKIIDLLKFLCGQDSWNIAPAERNRLRKQFLTMVEYSETLGERIHHFREGQSL